MGKGVAGGTPIRIDVGAAVTSIAFAPHEDVLAFRTADGEITLWDARGGAQTDTIAAKSGQQLFVTCSRDPPRLIWYTAQDGVLRVLDFSARTTKPVEHHPKLQQRTSMATSTDGRYVLLGGQQSVLLWDMATDRKVPLEREMEAAVRRTAVAVRPDGRVVAAASAHGTLRTWDTQTGRGVSLLSGHRARVLSAAFTPDGTHLVSGSADRTVKVWEVTTGTVIRTLRGHAQSVAGVAVSPDGNWIISGSADRTVRIWALRPEPEPAEFFTGLGRAVGFASLAHSRRAGWAIPADGNSSWGGQFGIRDWATWTLRDLVRGAGEQTRAYGATHLYTEEDRKVTFRIGSDDEIKVWLNGDVIHEHPEPRPLMLASDRKEAQLKAGWNTLLLRVDNRTGSWGFAIDAVDAQEWPVDLQWAPKPR